jgi:hypothetical protein
LLLVKNTARTTKLERKLDLIAAQLASSRGEHAIAAALFAKHGISYHQMETN